MTCDETIRCEMRTPTCTGWMPDGFPWHGCTLEPDHDTEGGRHRKRIHECKCGHQWETR